MQYIGIHSTSDISDGYMGSGTYLKRAIKKDGIDSFEREVLKIFNSREELLEAERQIVDLSFIERQDTYNLAIGGSGCKKYIYVNGEVKTIIPSQLFERFNNDIYYSVKLINHAPKYKEPISIYEKLHNTLVSAIPEVEKAINNGINNKYTNQKFKKMILKGNWLSYLSFSESKWCELTN